ncbi:hypothetical protein ACQEVG_06245 [Streptomyces sp. CA-135486]|uniref:hypothetical protein n=1 Tax=Streptomyces sp. CA-135486 TaxID=3240049 RepID=UPI003D89B48F
MPPSPRIPGSGSDTSRSPSRSASCASLSLSWAARPGAYSAGSPRACSGGDDDGPEHTGPLALAHALVSLPVNVAALTVTFYCWTVVAVNLGFPLRPDNDPTQSWGGPTLAGAWAVHAIGGGVPFLLLTPWVVKGFTKLQARLVTGFLGRDRRGLPRTAGIAAAVAAMCGVLSVPVIHQL